MHFHVKSDSTRLSIRGSKKLRATIALTSEALYTQTGLENSALDTQTKWPPGIKIATNG